MSSVTWTVDVFTVAGSIGASNTIVTREPGATPVAPSLGDSCADGEPVSVDVVNAIVASAASTLPARSCRPSWPPRSVSVQALPGGRSTIGITRTTFADGRSTTALHTSPSARSVTVAPPTQAESSASLQVTCSSTLPGTRLSPSAGVLPTTVGAVASVPVVNVRACVADNALPLTSVAAAPPRRNASV